MGTLASPCGLQVPGWLESINSSVSLPKCVSADCGEKTGHSDFSLHIPFAADGSTNYWPLSCPLKTLREGRGRGRTDPRGQPVIS